MSNQHNYNAPAAGVGIVVLSIPNEGTAYVLPSTEGELFFGGTAKTRGLIKIIEAGEGESFQKILAQSVKMQIIRRGTRGYKDYFEYEPGDEVVYIQMAHPVYYTGTYSTEVEIDYGAYFILGSFFDKDDTNRKPPARAASGRCFEFPDGTEFLYDRNSGVFGIDFGDKCYLKYDTETGDLMIKLKGDIVISGNEIHLN